MPSQVPGLQIDVVAPKPEGRTIPDPPGVRVAYFSAKTLVRLLYVFRYGRNPIANIILLLASSVALARNGLKLARARRYDVIYAVGGPIAGLAGIVVKARTRTPLAMHFHFAYAFAKRNAFMRCVARWFYGLADVVIGNCPDFASDAVALGLPERKCRWVLNWADEDLFKPRSDREALRQKYGLLPDQTAFLFAGRFDWTKYADRIIVALREFSPPQAVFLFAGGGQLEPLLEEISKKNRNVRLLGTVQRADLAELYNAADVQFFGAMDIDYPSLVVMEAMSSGLPVVTSSETSNNFHKGQRVDGAVIGSPDYARLYPPTPSGIRQAITESIANRTLYNAIRPDVARFAHERFGESNRSKLMEILSGVAGTPVQLDINVSTASCARSR